MDSDPVKVLGCDISLNHGGIVELVDGKLSNFWYYTDLAGSAGKSKCGTRMPTWSDIKDRQTKQMARLAWIEHYLDKRVFMKSLPQYVGIEDYALDAKHGAHYQGEVGGIARILAWFRGFQMRLHDPISLKMYAAHNGTADKDAVEQAVLSRWELNFGVLNQPQAPPRKDGKIPKPNRQTSQDLCDAYALAHLIWLEVRLRRGEVLLKDLHQKEVQIFNRVTKSYPVSLLDREWIANPDGVPTPHGEPVCATCGSRRCCNAKEAV